MTDENNYPIELTPPDISAYAKGNTGIDYATTFDSGKAGPHVCVSALVHGNELCGAIAADWLMREGVRPQQGKLSFLFCNIGAPAERCLFIDDSLKNVDGAKTVGMHAVHFQSPAKLEADLKAFGLL